MEFAKVYVIVAQTAEYNCDSYGTGAYNTCSTTGSGGATTNDGAASGGALANTGFDIILPVALAAAVLIASVAYIVKRWRRRNA